MPVDPKRGEVWYVSLDPTIGSEIRKTRPCVVVSSDSAGIPPLRLVVPLTAWQEAFTHLFWQVEPTPGSGLSKASAADTLQTRGVDIARFSSSGAAGMLPDATVAAIVEALAFTVGYDAGDI